MVKLLRLHLSRTICRKLLLSLLERLLTACSLNATKLLLQIALGFSLN